MLIPQQKKRPFRKKGKKRFMVYVILGQSTSILKVVKALCNRDRPGSLLDAERLSEIYSESIFLCIISAETSFFFRAKNEETIQRRKLFTVQLF